jgi:signal transduction histidine kinase
MFELERFADKGVMASTIAHELNNFLSLILGGVEIALINMERGKTEKVSDTLEKLRDNVTKMERFTAGLTDYTRLDTKKAPADLNLVITDVLSFVEVHRRFTKIRLTRELQPDMPVFDLDKDQIAQLLLNVLNNAADAIREGRPETPRITLKTFSDAERAGFLVSDNGAGVAPEIKERLFKAHLTTKENGHGYGLVTCARIIENHQGQVEIDSTPGQGATFRFSFPIVSQAAEQR